MRKFKKDFRFAFKKKVAVAPFERRGSVRRTILWQAGLTPFYKIVATSDCKKKISSAKVNRAFEKCLLNFLNGKPVANFETVYSRFLKDRLSRNAKARLDRVKELHNVLVNAPRLEPRPPISGLSQKDQTILSFIESKFDIGWRFLAIYQRNFIRSN